MSCVILTNVPNTPEGWAFLKELKKYLPPGTTMKPRGLHSDRKSLEAQGVKLNWCRDVPTKLAQRYRVYITAAPPMPKWLKTEGRRKWYFSVPEGSKVRWYGPLKSRAAAETARKVSAGI